jgi:hypothetical protein
MGTLLKTTSNLMSKIAKTAGFAILGKQVYNFAKSWMEMGSDLEEVQNVVDVTFKTMSERVNEFSKTTQMLVGINETTTKKYMGQFGSMSQAFGFTEEQAYGMSEALVKMAGDAASFNNSSIDVAFTKLKSVYTGETESLKDWGIVMTQSALDQHALAKGLNKTTAQMSEQEKVALRMNFVMEKLADAQGDYSRTSDGYANTMKNIAGIFEAAKTNFGQGFINMTAAMRTSLLSVAQSVQILSEKFLEFTRRFTKGKDVEGLKTSTSSIAEEMANIGTETEETEKKINRFVAGFDKLNKVSSGNSSGNNSTNANLINKLLAEAMDYNMGETQKKTKETNNILDKMAKKYPTLYKSMMGLWDSLKGIAGISWDYIKIFWKEFLKPMSDYAMENIIPGFLDVIAGLINVITGILKANKGLFKWLLENILTPLGKILGAVIATILKLLAGLLQKIAGFIEKHPKLIEAVTTALVILLGVLGAYKIIDTIILAGIALIGMFKSLGGVAATAAVIFPKLAGAISTVSASFMTLAANPITWVIVGIAALITIIVLLITHWDKVKEVAGNCFNFLNEKATAFKEKMQEYPQWMSDIGSLMSVNLMAPLKGFQEFVKTMFEEIKELSKDGTTSIGDYIKAIFKGVLNGIIVTIETTINALIKGLNGLSSLTGLPVSYKADKLSEVNLPRFAGGAYVKGTGDKNGIIARVGDVPSNQGEWILNTGQMRVIMEEAAINTARAISALGGTNGGDTEVNVYLDSDKVSNSIIKKNKRSRLATGTAVI